MLLSQMTLFNILKLNVSYIMEHDLSIELTYEEAMLNNYIVSLGDNQLFKFIRRLNNQENLIEEMNETKTFIHVLRKQDSSKQNISTLQQASQKLKTLSFVPDILSLKADTTKKDYKYICKNMFSIKFTMFGITYERTYKRLCAGAGQLRRNSAIFVNKDLYDELETIMLCGLTPKQIGKMNLAKFSAYFALYTSSSRQVKTPRICVVPDFEYTLKDQLVDWVYDNENGEKDIEERLIDFGINAFDGAGMVSPEMAKQWAEDLKCDGYIPSSFIIRAPFVKGAVSIFDFHEFADKIAHKTTITDLWGVEHNVNEIDVILTASQFKLYKKYPSWDSYWFYFKKYKHIFSVTRVNKKEDNKFNTLNYQYIQTNDFTKEDLKELASYSVNWAQRLLSKDYLTTILYLHISKRMFLDTYQIDGIDDELSQALMYCPSLLNDDYVYRTVTGQIKKQIDKMKIGKLLVEGAYEFFIPDLYAMAEHAFGMGVRGLLPKDAVWNKRWVTKGSKQIVAQRSPLVAPSENRLLNIYSNTDCEYWYKYIQSGNIINIWDMTAIAMSDADYDGDIIATTDNPVMVKAVGSNKKVITYKKTKAKEQPLNMNAFAQMDTLSFNTKIGVITNIVSNMISMKSIYKPEDPEYQELDKRIRLMRYFQGSAIDSAKGDVFVPPPKHWSKKQKFLAFPDNITEEQRQQIQGQNNKIAFNNKIAVDRKAYFFSYVYQKLRNDYIGHTNVYKKMCVSKFRCTISQLVKKENKTPAEVQFIHNYYKYMPVIKNNCTMNLLAYYIEDVEFENKWKKQDINFDWTLLCSEYFKPTNTALIGNVRKLISNAMSSYTHKKTALESDISSFTTEEEFDVYCKRLYYNIGKNLRDDLLSLNSNLTEVSNYVIYCYYKFFKNKSKYWMWDICGRAILNNLKTRAAVAYIPKKNPNGMEYFGERYVLEEVDLTDVDN